jgi:heme/copper-type cytochrome/quinol oxidase subunit 2
MSIKELASAVNVVASELGYINMWLIITFIGLVIVAIILVVSVAGLTAMIKERDSKITRMQAEIKYIQRHLK